MALLTTVEIRGGDELRLVLVCVAVKTATELDLVQRFFAAGNVALRALQSGVLALQGIGGRRMLGQPELRRLKPVHGVTGGALLTARALGELSLVLVLVAIHTLLEGERLFEIALAMAGNTLHLLVLPQQRILGLGVVETAVQSRRCNPLPSGGVVAGLTTLLCETPPMRIGVAIRTLAEGQSYITGLAVGARRCGTAGTVPGHAIR